MPARKNQASLTATEWTAFLSALDRLQAPSGAGARYRDFVRVHVAAMTTAAGMSWGVHTNLQMGMVGRNFLAWHRLYLVLLERRLRQVSNDPNLAIPYWDWIADPNLPARMNTPAFRARWGISRRWTPVQLPSAADVASVRARSSFSPFQSALERVHSGVHLAVGGDRPPFGTMSTASSPADPVFWLHHANIDRLWDDWAKSNPAQRPPDMNEVLQPGVGFVVRLGSRVSTVLDTNALGYWYS